MVAVGNTLHFQAIFFIKIESQYGIDNKRDVFTLVGLKK